MFKIAIAIYLLGMTVFYTWGQIEKTGWHDVYYLWDKGKDLLLFWSIYLLAGRSYKWVVMPALIFSVIRLTWQIISSITGWNINNTQVVGWLFIGVTSACSYLMLKELLKWRKLNSD